MREVYMSTNNKMPFRAWLILLKQWKPIGHCENGCHLVFEEKKIKPKFDYTLN